MENHLLAKQVLKIVSRIDVFQGPSWEKCKILFHQKHLWWRETETKHGSYFRANNFVPRMLSKIFINWISPVVESLGLVLLLLACVMIANGSLDVRFRTVRGRFGEVSQIFSFLLNFSNFKGVFSPVNFSSMALFFLRRGHAALPLSWEPRSFANVCSMLIPRFSQPLIPLQKTAALAGFVWWTQS